MRIGFDLDDVIYPFVSQIAKYACARIGHESLPPATCWRFYETDWGLSRYEFERLFLDGIESGVVFGEGEPLPGTLDGLSAVKAAGHTVHIVSDRLVSPRAQELTPKWLAEHSVPYDTLTFSADKTVVATDMFLDDRPENVKALRSAGVDAWVLDCGRTDQAAAEPKVESFEAFVAKVLDRKLVGISGYARSGKDTVAGILVERGWRRIAFADTLKLLAEKVDPPVDGHTSLRDLLGAGGWEQAKSNQQVRRFLQDLGGGVRDVLGLGIWVDALFRSTNGHTKIVIPDMRYPNEMAEIKRRGGLTVRVNRPGIGPAPGHISDIALDEAHFDLVIDNDGNLQDLRQKVEDVLLPALEGHG